MKNLLILILLRLHSLTEANVTAIAYLVFGSGVQCGTILKFLFSYLEIQSRAQAAELFAYQQSLSGVIRPPSPLARGFTDNI